jgi:integrase
VVPLSAQAIAVLKSAASVQLPGTDLIFPGARGGLMSDMTMRKVLDRAKEPFTVHGFRSSFRDWVAEQTSFPREVAEAALAHANPNEVEAAYQRGTLLDKRRRLMESWGSYCAKQNAETLIRFPRRVR